MFQIFRASKELMIDVVDILNSNSPLYRPIVLDAATSDEVDVTLEWAENNFSKREFYIIRDEGSSVGFATYQNLGKFSYIGYFFIRFSEHRKGYGHSLMNFLQLRTMTENLPEIRLFVHQEAHWAIQFYQKLGFEILSREKAEIIQMDDHLMESFYVDDHIYMRKQLSHS